LRKVQLFAGEVEEIDLRNSQLTLSHGFRHHSHIVPYDRLILALGSITNFYNLPGLADHALTMKSLGDAIALRNRLIAQRAVANVLNTRVAAVSEDSVALGNGMMIRSCTIIWTAGTTPNPIARPAMRQGSWKGCSQ
jgi:NADH dehydrogenase FAD-containing subunit